MTETAKVTKRPVRLETIGLAPGVAVVTVDNPPVNAMSGAVLIGLRDIALQLGNDSDIRVVVVTGAGDRAFMAGADITEFTGMLNDLEAVVRHTALTREVLELWELLPQPVIAAAQASAVGGGLELALVCDFVVADPLASFGTPEVRLGLMPGAGGTQRLPRLIGARAAKELLLGGDVIDAERAASLGLVNAVSQPGDALEEACSLAARLAALPAVAVQAIKRATAATRSDLVEGLDHERELFFKAFASEDFREGHAAFLEKREPRFRHR